MQMLKIIKCSDGMRWYASKVGELVPYLGDSMGAHKSREEQGYINFVQYEDAEVVTLERLEERVEAAWVEVLAADDAKDAASNELTKKQSFYKKLKLELEGARQWIRN